MTGVGWKFELTDNGEIDAVVLGGRHLEVDSAPVLAGVRLSDVIDRQYRRRRVHQKLGVPVRQDKVVLPLNAAA